MEPNACRVPAEKKKKEKEEKEVLQDLEVLEKSGSDRESP
jgi:hypothetical protein